MAIKYEGLKSFGFAIHPTAAKPLDDRSVVESFADLINGSLGTAVYDGMLVSVIEDNKVYLRNTINNVETWTAIGSNNSGNGTITATTYTDAISLATNENVGQLIYVTTASEVTENDNTVTYSEGLYVVIGDGQLSKINTTDYQNQLNVLSDRISEIENKPYVSDITDGENTLVVNGVANLTDFVKTTTLTNYYTKNEINDKFKEIDLFSIVPELPTENINENKIYLIFNKENDDNKFVEYIYVNTGTTDVPLYTWEKIGELNVSTDLTNYFTKDEINEKLNTTEVKLSGDIDDSYKKDETVQSVLSNIHSRIKSINASIESALSGGVTSISEGVGITVDTTDSTTSPKVSVKISSNENNALTYDDNNSLLVDQTNLETRLAELESLLSGKTLIFADNISQYAITSLSYDSTIEGDKDSDDILITGDKGDVKITLNSITNIAYNDAK